MSPTLRLWSHSRSMFRGTVLRPLTVKHQQANQNSYRSVLPCSLTSNIFCTSAILSVYKDQKPGRLRRHAESVNNKVCPMQGSYDIHFRQKNHWHQWHYRTPGQADNEFYRHYRSPQWEELEKGWWLLTRFRMATSLSIGDETLAVSNMTFHVLVKAIAHYI